MDQKQKFERIYRPYLYHIIRPIGRKGVLLAIKWKLIPNQVTIVSIIIEFIAMVLFGIGGFLFQILGVITIHLRQIFDTIDGDLARKIGQTTKKGEYLDAISGYLLGGILLPSIGLGLALVPDKTYFVFNNIINISPWFYISIGLFGGLISILTRLISLRYKYLFGNSLRDFQKGKLFIIVSCFEDFLLPMLFIGAIMQVMGFVLLIYCSYYLAKFLYVLYKSLKV